MELAVSKNPVELSDIGREVFVLELSLNCEINYVSANLLQVVGYVEALFISSHFVVFGWTCRCPYAL